MSMFLQGLVLFRESFDASVYFLGVERHGAMKLSSCRQVSDQSELRRVLCRWIPFLKPA